MADELAPDVIRPATVDELAGLAGIKEGIAWHTEHGWPRGLLLSGAPGTGKTTVARIVRTLVRDGIETAWCEELGCASLSADAVRTANETRWTHSRDLTGARSVVILNEVHALSKVAQEVLCDALERPHAPMFILTTVDSARVDAQIVSRCLHWRFVGLAEAEAKILALNVAQQAGVCLKGWQGLPSAGRDVVQWVLGSAARTESPKLNAVITALSAQRLTWDGAYKALCSLTRDNAREMCAALIQNPSVPLLRRVAVARWQNEVCSAMVDNWALLAAVLTE